MPEFSINTLLIVLGVIAIITEIIIGAATGFDIFVVGVTLIIGGFIGTIFNSPQIAFLISAVLIFLYILTVRSVIKNSLSIKTHKTSVDNLIDKRALVIKDIVPHKPGQIKVEGEIWRAESDKEVKAGTTVKIESVSGVTLKVS